MIIRKFNIEAKEVCKLVCDSFNKFVAKDCTKNGIKEFLADQTPEKQIKRAKSRYTYVALIGNKIVGVIEAKPNDRITRLFVHNKYLNHGIGRKLTDKIEKLYVEMGFKKIKVRSSLIAINFYEKLGYKKSKKLTKSHGILYQPMIKNLR